MHLFAILFIITILWIGVEAPVVTKTTHEFKKDHSHYFLEIDSIPDTMTSLEILEAFIHGDTNGYQPMTIVYIQFGAFASEEKAVILESRLIENYQGVYILEEYNEQIKKQLYKVVIGPVDEYALRNISKRLDRDSITYWTKPINR